MEPIIVKKDMTIIGGHQQLKGLKHLGYTEVDCVVVEVDKTKEKALNVVLTGFELPEMDELFSKLNEGESKEDNFDVDGALTETPMTKQGDVWLRGKHRLICGDSKDGAVYEILMDGKKANLVVTNPPYNGW